MADARMALKVQEQLSSSGYAYPRLTQISQKRVQLIEQPGMVPSQSVDSAAARGYRLSSADSSWHVSLTSDSFSIETTDYRGWSSDFRRRLSDLVEAVAILVEPTLEVRLGLRYVNVLRGTTTVGRALAPSDFAEVVRPWVLGPLVSPDLLSGVLDVNGRSVFTLDGDAQLTARYGIVAAPDGEPSYLLDYDAYREASRPFDSREAIAAADSFNEVVGSLFEHSVTESCLASMRETRGGNR